jgi:leucyl/phenylalanyl-tRNA--protein transferase
MQPRLSLREQLTWQNARSKLQQTRGQLRELSNKGCVRVQRVLGRASTYLPPTPLGALCGVADTFPLTAENVMLGYAQGIFAMDFAGEARWHCPPERFVVYLNELRISSNMRRELKRESYDVTFDQAPREVLDACATDRVEGEGTWLSERFIGIYLQLWEMGAMHTVEAWKDGKLVGGSFGVSIGRVWTSESMFHRAPHAGKVQFAAVAAHLKERGFEAVDGQMYSDHFARFGARDIPIAEYRALLARGLANPAHFHPNGQRPKPGEAPSPAPAEDGTPPAATNGKQKQKKGSD